MGVYERHSFVQFLHRQEQKKTVSSEYDAEGTWVAGCQNVKTFLAQGVNSTSSRLLCLLITMVPRYAPIRWCLCRPIYKLTRKTYIPAAVKLRTKSW